MKSVFVEFEVYNLGETRHQSPLSVSDYVYDIVSKSQRQLS